MLNVNKRSIAIFCAILCSLLLGISFYFQYVADTLPCLLCMLQRFIVIILSVLFILISLFNPTKHLTKCFYGTAITLTSTLGLLLSGRHIWLQMHSDTLQQTTQVSCLPGLPYMLENFSFVDIIKQVISHANTCHATNSLILGVDLSVWLLLFFGFFLLVGLIYGFTTKPLSD